MPVEFPSFNGEGDPRDALIKFLRALHDLLKELVETNRDSRNRPIFFEQLLTPMRRAWDEFERDRHFSAAESRILAEEGPVHDLVLAQLRNHGLYGQQLSFKLSVIHFFYNRYLSTGKGILKWVLDIIDDLLKSLLDAIGGGGAISEMKDFIKDSVDDADA
jgi:hypothetical protein